MNEKPELFVVKGLNEKKNYLINSYSIYDLESNIPIQSTERNFHAKRSSKLATKNMKRHRYNNQRKIYADNTRYIGMEMPNILSFAVTRMDLVFWKNI